MRPRWALALAAALVPGASAAALDSFLPPVAGQYAANADMAPATIVASPEECAQRCVAWPGPQCVSFNLCAHNATHSACGVSGWNVSYVPAAAATCAWYRRSLPRDDRPATQAVPWQLAVPHAGVALTGGPLADAFGVNVAQYLGVRDPLDMLHFFAQRAGAPGPLPGQCWGWDGWIPGSAMGNYLMGAGNALQWTDNATLRADVARALAGVAAYAQPNGWAFAFAESNITYDNLPDYCAGWVTRGLLDAAGAGLPDALALARGTISAFNNHSLLPFILPPNGGPDPVQPYPSGFNNVTSGGYGQPTGHMIYIEYQGMIKHTLMALSGAGTAADVDLVADHYQEDWWLAALAAGDLYHGVWHRQFFSHNYEVTAWEALLDMYVLTGNATYLDAMLSAWRMLRSHWIHPGGSMAINEGAYYPPDSYYIGFHGVVVSEPHQHGHGHGHGHAEAADKATAGGDPYYHAPCMWKPNAEEPTAVGASNGTSSAAASGGDDDGAYRGPLARMKARASTPAPPTAGSGNPNDSQPPTGELCGSVFWTHFNQRFHRLFPDNETFVWEMERSILNVGLAAQGRPGSGGEGPGGTGIRYFANLHKQKQNPSMHASCCEGQGTRLFGSLPQYLFSLVPPGGRGYASAGVRDDGYAAGGPNGTAGAAAGVYVDIYAPSVLTFAAADGSGGVGSVNVTTDWPYGGDVAIALTLPPAADGAPTTQFDLALRMPAWAAAAAVPVTVNGAPWPSPGVPCSYLHLSQAWPAGATSTVTFTLQQGFTAHPYAGASQLPPYTRVGYSYGATLMAGTGPWNATVDALVLPAAAAGGLDPLDPGAWMTPAGDGNPLHFAVKGAPGFAFVPYFEIQDAGALFDVFPAF